jgi:hypothetical protein
MGFGGGTEPMLQIDAAEVAREATRKLVIWPETHQ